MEEKKLLSQAFLRSPLCLLLLIPFFFHVIVPPALAADFGSSVQSGRAIGSGLVTDFNPQNLNQTLQNKGLGASESLTPKIDEARQNKGNYSGFYNNPGGMGSTSTDPKVEAFVNQVYENRQKYDLTQDAAFGSQCLETGADGKCTRWSASKDLVTNTYKDCEKVLIPNYDDPASEAICTGSNQITTTQCDVTTYAHAVTEDLALSCDQYSPDYRDGQIYAFCKDIYKWYKVYAGTGRESDDCSCENHAGAVCYTPPLFEVNSQAPEG